MKRRLLIISLLTFASVTLQVPLIAQGNAPRLVADNRTDYYADIYALNGSTWNHVMRVNPHSWAQFPYANNGSQWRAVIGQAVRDHVVNYVWDAGYGGYQDVWWIQ